MVHSFILNGETVHIPEGHEQTTLLQFIRETRHLTGTKEGCNEGDCGACTAIVTDQNGTKAVASCILFLPQLAGKAVRTIEGISDHKLHTVQKSMIEAHGSQCGFCTPGFVMSLAAADINHDNDTDTILAGNLCRCTGYTPIARAAKQHEAEQSPAWLQRDQQALNACASAELAPACPGSSDALARLLSDTPETRIIAGATDVGLWVTKGMQDLGPVAFLSQCQDLQHITQTPTHLEIGAAVTVETVRKETQTLFPSLAQMLRRFASTQVRNSATLAGNIANGSPIGDAPPPLIALRSSLILRKGDTRREVLLEDFFIDYGKQDLGPSEFVEKILIPKAYHALRVYKLSKRFDQDISALCAAFNIEIRDGKVTSARIAFGGMAAIPKRAAAVEQALLGQDWSLQTLRSLTDAWQSDFQPISDMRASASYRIETAENLLIRYFHDINGDTVDLSEVRP
jgi:xanthine dehydrogenase small subunit